MEQFWENVLLEQHGIRALMLPAHDHAACWLMPAIPSLGGKETLQAVNMHVLLSVNEGSKWIPNGSRTNSKLHNDTGSLQGME